MAHIISCWLNFLKSQIWRSEDQTQLKRDLAFSVKIRSSLFENARFVHSSTFIFGLLIYTSFAVIVGNNLINGTVKQPLVV